MARRVIAGLVLIGTVACSKKDESGVALADTSQPATASQSTDASTAGAGTPASYSAAPTVDKDAVAALDRMGNYLRSLKAFQVRATTSRDEVLENGQKVQFASTQEVLVQRPNRFRGDVTSDAARRLYFYDGKNFTVYAPRPGYYASVPASGTLIEVSDRLQSKFDIELPLRDLFLWGTDRSGAKDITSAVDIGPSEVDGTTVEQYAFRQNGIDWQVWIQQGEYPLPRKLVITTTTDDARPDYSAVMSWNLAPSFNDAAFTFDPPTGAQKILLAETDTLSRGN
jgi:hypothetical protein